MGIADSAKFTTSISGCTLRPRTSSNISRRCRRGHGGLRSMVRSPEVDAGAPRASVAAVVRSARFRSIPSLTSPKPGSLEGGESGLWRVSMPSFRKFPGDLEHPLVAADHQPLQVQLGAIRRSGRYRVHGPGDERTCERTAGLRLEDRRVDLQEVELDEGAPHRRQCLEPDIEDPPAVLVDQQSSSRWR